MIGRAIRVRFASGELERDFKRLERSKETEDRKTFRSLKEIRTTLQERHALGTEIPSQAIPLVDQLMFAVRRLWSLPLPPHGTVLYTKVGKEILIVDIV